MKNFTAVTPIEQKALGITQLQTTYTGNELDWSSGVVGNGGDFRRRTLFEDNCQNCKKNSMKNLDAYGGGDYGYGGGGTSGGSGGGFLSGVTAGGLLNQAGGVLNNYFQSQTSQNAAQIAQANAAAAASGVQNQQAQNTGAAIENQGKVATIKAYIVPISIVGGLAILGIATYFIFKKKKIN
jgi:hypothetical protein